MNLTVRMFARLLVLVVLLGVASGVEGQSRERHQVIRLLTKAYKRVADAKNILFEVDQFRVIRAKFDKRKKLIELAAEPKYYFADEHTDWLEPADYVNLSRAEFEKLSTELGHIKALGKKVESVNQTAIVTNLTAWYSECYRNASLTWGVVEDLRKDDDSYEVRWFRFRYGADACKLKFVFSSTPSRPSAPKSQPKHRKFDTKRRKVVAANQPKATPSITATSKCPNKNSFA